MEPIKKKVCMVGAFAVGKTSLVRRYVDDSYSESYQTTIGVTIEKKQVHVGGQPVNLMLWDTEGEDGLANFKPSYVRGAAGVILVADGCRAATLDTAIELEERIRAETGPLPLILAVNKSDLAGQWEIRDEALELLRQRGWTYTKTSAKDGSCVEALFHDLARKMLQPKE